MLDTSSSKTAESNYIKNRAFASNRPPVSDRGLHQFDETPAYSLHPADTGDGDFGPSNTTEPKNE